MTLAEFRLWFKSLAGQLNVDNKTIDMLANTFIQQVGPMFDGSFSTGIILTGLPAGSQQLNLSEYMMGISNLWIYKNGVYIELPVMLDIAQFFTLFSDRRATGEPQAAVCLGSVSVMESEDSHTTAGTIEGYRSSDFKGQGGLILTFSHVADQHYDMRLFGPKKLEALIQDNDTNLLTEKYPFLLVQGCLWVYELTLRHYKEADALWNQIKMQIASLNMEGFSQKAAALGDQIHG